MPGGWSTAGLRMHSVAKRPGVWVCPGGTDARFPGFVGPDFERSRGVLCMDHVHRYLPDTDDVPLGVAWMRSSRPSSGGGCEGEARKATPRSSLSPSLPTWPPLRSGPGGRSTSSQC